MSNITRLFALCISLSCGLAMTACSDDPEVKPGATGTGTAGTTPTGNPTGTGTDTTPNSCDPKGANPAMGDLLNAPVGPTVTVIKKAPAHPTPNNPGPNGLP